MNSGIINTNRKVCELGFSLIDHHLFHWSIVYNTGKKVIVVAPCRQICHLVLISSLIIVTNKSNNCGTICKTQALKQLRGGEKGSQCVALSTILNTRTNADNSFFFLNSFWIWRYCKILMSHKWMRMLWNPIFIPWDTHIRKYVHTLGQNLCFTVVGWCGSFLWLRQDCWERGMAIQRGWVEVRRSVTSATLYPWVVSE